MPRRVLLPLRLLLLATAVAAFAVAGTQLARAEGEAPAGGSVTIAPSGGGEPTTLSLADLAAQQDVHGATYTVRAADGGTSTVTVAAGVSLEALLRAAGLDGDVFTYVSIPRPDGSGVVVLRDELGGTDEGPPVVWADEQGVRFLRPSDGDGDANAGDLVTAADGALALDLRRGEPLVPRIAVSTLRGRPRQPIEFSASLASGTLPAGMDYQWYFDGNGTVMGANVTHRFPRASTYLVLLNVVRGNGEAVGLPARVRVRIVRPANARRTDGARRSDESHDGAQGTGGSGTGVSGTGGTGGDEPGGGAPSRSAPATPPARAVPRAAPRSSPARPEGPRGELVTGTLLVAAAAPPPTTGEADRQSASARDDGGGDPLDVPVGVWVATGLVALLALGWTSESRHTLPFWQP
jgi:hypothetical protein